jgi:hypothetical protein
VVSLLPSGCYMTMNGLSCKKQSMSSTVSLLHIHLLIFCSLTGSEGWFEWHHIPECMEIMKMLQNVPQALELWVQTVAKNVNVNTIYSRCNDILDPYTFLFVCGLRSTSASKATCTYPPFQWGRGHATKPSKIYPHTKIYRAGQLTKKENNNRACIKACPWD